MVNNFYGMRRNIWKVVVDLIGKGYDDDEILIEAISRYGATEKMVMSMIKLYERKIAKATKKQVKK